MWLTVEQDSPTMTEDRKNEHRSGTHGRVTLRPTDSDLVTDYARVINANILN